MNSTPSTIKIFQTSAFRVDDINTFLAHPAVNHVTQVMNHHNLPFKLANNHISLSLPTETLNYSEFEDDTNKVDSSCLLSIVAVIEAQILEGDVCKMMYIEAKTGEYFDVYTSIIEKHSADSGKVSCEHFWTYERDGFRNVEAGRK